MSLETKTSQRFSESPRDKPQVDRVEFHANLERPGAQFHPRAGSAWNPPQQKFSAWRSR